MYHAGRSKGEKRPGEGEKDSGEVEEKSVKASPRDERRKEVGETAIRWGCGGCRDSLLSPGARVARPLSVPLQPKRRDPPYISPCPLRRAPPGSYDPPERGARVTHASSCSHTRSVGPFARTCVVLPIPLRIGHRRCCCRCIPERHTRLRGDRATVSDR